MVGKTSLNTDAHGWTWIVRNNKQETSKYIRNPFQKDVERIATSFFILNFPEHIDAKGLWKVCESYGCIVDAFIANKRSKVGKRFQIQKTVVENPKKETIKVAAPVLEKHVGKIESCFSYLSIRMFNIVNSIEVALVKVKRVETMSTMYRLCREEGFDIVKIHHVGRLWLWLQFQNVDSCTAVKNNKNLKTLFTTIKPVSRSFYVDERMRFGLKYQHFHCVHEASMYSRKWLTRLSINLDDSLSHNSEDVSKGYVASANEEESECEGDFHELYQEDKVEKVDDDKCEMENNRESNQSNTPQEMNREEQKEARPDEDIEKDDSD
ncbi:hypothetical protein Tco_0206600 [Tanacetum coccineum]